MPPCLRALLDERGYATLPQWADAHGVGYSKALHLVESGVLGAIDVRSEDSSRPSYRILECHVQAFYERRSTNVGKADLSQRPQRRIRKPRKKYIV